MASVILRTITIHGNHGATVYWGPSMKLGFDKSKVTYFKCKQKGHFKRECQNSAVDETSNPFHDYYRKAVYHRNREEPPKMKQIEDNPK
ncbi:putative transcription factor interactor and regulator CCHC(Zn) family [Helianthus anomalus]